MASLKKQILELLEQLWSMHPDERFGQLLENNLFTDREIFFQEDEVTVKKLKEQLGSEFSRE
ncbi:MAG: hypothetical protein AABW81_04270 [Nanoarchaeota archaeon]